MIAENKAEFFEQLQRELEKLGVEDTGELMVDLEEHFAEGERRGVPEAETCRELGNIAEIARSCLDLKSTAINSMVARDVQRKKGVSLTKPGHSVPADPSLAAPEQTIPVNDLPSYTPEHISEEIYPNAVNSNTSGGAASAGEAGSAETVGSESADSSASGGSPNGTDGGTFEKVGKAVDVAFDKAGKALNDALNKAGAAVGAFRPSDSYREHVNNGKNGGEIPPQYTKVKGNGGSKFVDTSGMTPNVNGGRLAGEILLDVFLWSWLIPLIFSLVIAAFGVGVGMIVGGIQCIIGNSVFVQFKFITRVLFMLGFFNLSAAVFCLAPMLLKGSVGLVKNVIARHLRAIYDI